MVRSPALVARFARHARAAFVLFHVAAVVVLAVPTPDGVMQRAAWKDGTVQGEFAAWSERLRALDPTLTPARLEAIVWRASEDVVAARRIAVAPFLPYARVSGTDQSWRLFTAPQRWPIRIEVDVLEDGVWRPVYRLGDDEHAWRTGFFDSYRGRRIVQQLTWDHRRRAFAEFAAWLADRAAADFPRADRMRIRQLRYRTPTPAEAGAGRSILEAKYVHEVDEDLRGRR